MEVFEISLPEGVYVEYVISVVLITYLLLKYVLKSNTSESYRVRTNILVGVILGSLLYFFKDYDLKSLIVSLTTTTSMYQWVIQVILKYFGLNYKNSDPQLVD